MIKGLIVILTQGFANRLKMLASSFIYSKHILHLDLYICWPNASDCNIDYYSIFEDKHQNLFKIIEYGDISKLKYHFFGRVHTVSVFNKIDSIIKNSNDCEFIVLEGGHEYNHPKLGKRNFLFYKNKFYRSLFFNEKIIEKVNLNLNKIKCKFKTSNYVAIHYRNFVQKYDGLDGGRSNKVHFTDNSPFEEFCRYISIIKNNYPLFILSNSNDSVNKFRKKFPNKIIYSTDIVNFERDNKNGVFDSIIEFLILSKSNLLIGSYFSSFSDEASFFSMIPKLTPLSKKLISNLNETILGYHCLNYSFNEGIASLNYSENKIFKYLEVDKF